MSAIFSRILGILVIAAALVGGSSWASAQADLVATKMITKLEAVTNKTIAKTDLILASTMSRVGLLRSRGVPEVKIAAMLDKIDLQLDRTLAGVRLSIDKIETAGINALTRFGSPTEQVQRIHDAADNCHTAVTAAQARADEGLAAWRNPA